MRRLRLGRARIVAIGVVALGLVGVVGALFTDSRGPLDEARHELADDNAFARASDAGAALTRASSDLQRAGEDCGEGERCDELFTAAAVVRVAAVGVLRCSRPQIFEIRAELRDYLDQLDHGDSPTPPAPTLCE